MSRKIFYLLIALAIALPTQLPALADGDSQLKADVPKIDDSNDAPSAEPKLPSTYATTRLTGSVDMLDSTSATPSHDVNLQSGTSSGEGDKVQLQSRAATTDGHGAAFRLAIEKLAARKPLTTEDYRALGIGVLGYVSNRSFFTNRAEITDLIPGCPAETAGIKVGDLEISRDDSAAQTDTHGLTMFVCGLAGTPVNVEIKRRGHTIHFQLVRMNVEDIPDDYQRRDYERMIRRMAAKLVKAYPQVDLNAIGQ